MELILKYFNKLNSNQIEQFNLLDSLYKDWNRKINVISRKDIEALYERHVLHSLAIAKIIEFTKGTQILDIGTGGGFPGIPLAILFPETDFLLIDSIKKKIIVVEDIIKQLKLENASAKPLHSNDIHEKSDFVISRAVTAFPEFLKLVKSKIKKEQRNSLPNGIMYLKGGDLDHELKNYKNSIQLYRISNFFEEDFFKTKSIVYYPY